MKVISRRNALFTSHLREENRFETGYSFEIVSQCKYSSPQKQTIIENITVRVSRQSLKTLKLMYRVQ